MDFTVEEMLAAHLSHSFHDGEVGFTGLATGRAASMYITAIPMVAMRLAQLTHAPNLTILFNGWCINPDISQLDFLPESEYDNALLNLPCEAHMTAWPGPWSHHRGEVSFGFCSGAQVDSWGNVNCTAIGNPDQPKVALVGPIFVPEHLAEFGREYIMLPHHEARTFPEKVDCISGVGFPHGREGRTRLKLPGAGPSRIYTPKCIFAFDEDGRAQVEYRHPGITEEKLRECTGFALGDLSHVPETPAPTQEELYLIRQVIDPKQVWFPREDKE